VLSTWSAPVSTDSLAWQHVQRGVGYQIKRGADLVASIKDGRAMYQLSKMLETWEECWGVFVGKIDAFQRDTWHLSIDERDARFTYPAYISHVRNWQRAGGKWLPLDPNYPFEQWVEDELQRLGTSATERTLRKPSLSLIPLSPAEETLATFPLLGPQRARALWNYLPLNLIDQTLTQALVYLSDGWATRVEGIGKGVVEAARRHLGLKEHENLGIYIDDDFSKLKGE